MEQVLPPSPSSSSSSPVSHLLPCPPPPCPAAIPFDGNNRSGSCGDGAAEQVNEDGSLVPVPETNPSPIHNPHESSQDMTLANPGNDEEDEEPKPPVQESGDVDP
ncbi:hypothetical protein KOW79_020847 [Hemibagrus wyckioides]|uniref:Uncharacterized protein n=1 Tax=Hemibagrus wyckioides TaxID=337641 RepID=A0A9D3S964_9TELE|nr:hypothetical protein KOW79_020847 [Hemibagrus wyckioides]